MTTEEPDGNRPARIVRLANFVGPTSGGLRTALREWGRGYLAAGHEPVLIVPAGRASDTMTDFGRVITVPSPTIPGTGGYRLMISRGHVRRRLAEVRPDRVEVHDRTTLRWVGGWARARGIPSVVVSHERLDALLQVWGFRGRRPVRIADWLNRRTAQVYDAVVVTTGWASAEFARLGITNVRRVPLGVNLALFHPSRHDAALRGRLANHGELLVVQCTRLHPEKSPHRVIYAIEALRNRGVRAAAVVAGDGPLRERLVDQARGLPIRFAGFGHDRGDLVVCPRLGTAVPAPRSRLDIPGRRPNTPGMRALSRQAQPTSGSPDPPSQIEDRPLARLLATADVVIAPGPVETFGLAALEALACGTPAVAPGDGALGEVIGDAGVVVRGLDDVIADGEAFADGLLQVAALPPAARRLAARRQAERFGWPASVQAMLRAHGLSIDVEVA
jgi:alpha-1,6-mannosyltransferase